MTLLKELNALEHEMQTVAHEHLLQQQEALAVAHEEADGPAAVPLLHAASHAALAGVLDGVAPAQVEQQIEEMLDHLAKYADHDQYKLH